MTIEEMMQMREGGATYQQIADKCGISRQRVQQKLGKCDKGRFRGITADQCIYVGLRNWMNENKVSRMALVRIIYGYFHPTAYDRIRSRLVSPHDEIPKKFIDKILEITGLTYEECFRKEKGNGN